MPNISMNPSHHYVTQSSAYDRLLTGKVLTDRRITQLKKKGWFGNGILSQQRVEKVKRKREKSTFLKSLMEFGK